VISAGESTHPSINSMSLSEGIHIDAKLRTKPVKRAGIAISTCRRFPLS
jgi:hypothetical protein